MNSNFANNARRLLIKFGKVLPFIVCFIILIAYIENIYSLYTKDFLCYENCFTLNTPITFWIATKMQYDLLVLVVITIISYATETCCWNKLAILYLFIQLVEKSYFSTIELYPEYIYLICIINIIISAFFVWKGLRILINQ